MQWPSVRMRLSVLGFTAMSWFACRDVPPPASAIGQTSSFVSQNISFARIIHGRLFDIFLISENGVGLVNITDHAANDVNPQWSPDGTLLSFESTREGSPNVFIVSAAGGTARNVSRLERGAWRASWFPDSKRVAFVGETVTTISIYVANLVDSSVTDLTLGNGICNYPRVSPDGSHIAFVSDRDGPPGLYVMRSDGSDARRLTAISGFDETFTLNWSPDSRRLLFNLNVNGQRDVMVINSDGSGLINLTNHPADDVGGSWSPDGRLIVFQSNRSGHNGIHRMDAAGGPATRISSSLDDRDPQFSPNGLWVMFLTARRGAYEIWLVDPGGYAEIVVTPTPISDLTPRWKPIHGYSP